jgi:hypothetical protein
MVCRPALTPGLWCVEGKNFYILPSNVISTFSGGKVGKFLNLFLGVSDAALFGAFSARQEIAPRVRGPLIGL